MKEVAAETLPVPSKIYIQIDGACDNVVKAVYVSMEHLVFKKLHSYVLIRLPVGQTYEDIDSRFGVIFKALRKEHICTPQQFQAAVKSAFGNSRDVDVVRVFYVMVFKAYYDQFIDNDLEDKFTKNEDGFQGTIHLFKIEPLRECDALQASMNNLLVRTSTNTMMSISSANIASFTKWHYSC